MTTISDLCTKINVLGGQLHRIVADSHARDMKTSELRLRVDACYQDLRALEVEARRMAAPVILDPDQVVEEFARELDPNMPGVYELSLDEDTHMPDVATCPTCHRRPSERYDLQPGEGPDIDPADICSDPIHDLADQLVAELFAEADALGIPRDAATVREAVKNWHTVENARRYPIQEKKG